MRARTLIAAPQERLNKEVRRRADVVGSSPTRIASPASSALCSSSKTTSTSSSAATCSSKAWSMPTAPGERRCSAAATPRAPRSSRLSPTAISRAPGASLPSPSASDPPQKGDPATTGTDPTNTAAVGGIIPERWARSNRNGGRHHFGMTGAMTSESAEVGTSRARDPNAGASSSEVTVSSVPIPRSARGCALAPDLGEGQRRSLSYRAVDGAYTAQTCPRWLHIGTFL